MKKTEKHALKLRYRVVRFGHWCKDFVEIPTGMKLKSNPHGRLAIKVTALRKCCSDEFLEAVLCSCRRPSDLKSLSVRIASVLQIQRVSYGLW